MVNKGGHEIVIQYLPIVLAKILIDWDEDKMKCGRTLAFVGEDVLALKSYKSLFGMRILDTIYELVCFFVFKNCNFCLTV